MHVEHFVYHRFNPMTSESKHFILLNHCANDLLVGLMLLKMIWVLQTLLDAKESYQSFYVQNQVMINYI